jgi:flagellar basal-body rod protein FlgG
VGRLSVVDVKDKSTLEKAGSNLYAGVNGKPLRTVPARDYSISQGSLEMANVKVVNQMVSMISAHRAFESYQKAVLVMQDIDSKAATQVGRVA